jgi:hypothetical protein
MRWWPTFGRSDESRGGGYTDEIVRRLVDRASGTTSAVAGATSALEACAGTIGRCLAAAEVSGSAFSRDALTPATLMLIGRELIRKGEAQAVGRRCVGTGRREQHGHGIPAAAADRWRRSDRGCSQNGPRPLCRETAPCRVCPQHDPRWRRLGTGSGLGAVSARHESTGRRGCRVSGGELGGLLCLRGACIDAVRLRRHRTT